MKSLVVLVTLVLLLGQNADGLDLPLSLADELDGLPDGFLDTALFSFLGETFSDFTFPSFGSQDDSPTPQPTSSPTNMPTPSPTTATEAPTDSTLIVDPHPVPSNPPSKYFNYDDDSDYGPNNWKNVDTSEHWLKEFGPNGFGPWANQIDYDPSDNQCDRNVRRQSPKDLSSTIECDAIHEIRTWVSQQHCMECQFVLFHLCSFLFSLSVEHMESPTTTTNLKFYHTSSALS